MTDNNLDILFADLPNRSLLRPDEVAKFMGVKKRTVLSWYPEQLQGTSLNGIVRIYRQSVIDLVKKNNGKKRSDEDIIEIEKKIKDANDEESFKKIPHKGWVAGWKK